MRNSKLLPVVEGGIFIALAVVLSYIKIWQMPQGGSITAVSMLPLIVYCEKWGPKRGFTVTISYAILNFLLKGGFSISPWSFLLDYLLAFGSIGISSFFYGNKTKAAIGAALGVFARFVFLVISGVVLWGMYAPVGKNPFIYSLTYNGTYMIPELIITTIIMYLIYGKFEKFMKRKTA